MQNNSNIPQEHFEDDDNGEKKTQSQILVGLASDITLFYDEQDNSYARIKVKGHYEVWPIRSSGFRDILTYRYMNLHKNKDKVPGNQALQDALRALDAKARLEGKIEKVHVRIAETVDSIYLDLCNDGWEVVEINKEGWRVTNQYPVYFKRSKIMQPLPKPNVDGNINDLKSFINYNSEDDYKLIIAWLLSTFRENSPFPILTIQGEQGSAKSTTTKVLRSLIDPSALSLRALPSDERDLSIAANNTWILTFDNLSGLNSQMSDALCKVSTGGGLSTRKLFTDDEESVFNIMRPIILNGIDDIAKRQDLLDRSIVINLPSIPEKRRTDEKTFWENFASKKDSILGALCTIVSKTLEVLPHTELGNKPRMADFALWITAAEEALNWDKGEFIRIYQINRDVAIEQGIESDPFACSILELIKRKGKWIGNATQLLAEAAYFTDDRTLRSKSWPTARNVRNRLRRINPALRKMGYLYVEWENKMKKTLKLERVGDTSSLTSYSNQTVQDKRLTIDKDMTEEVVDDGVQKLSSSRKPYEINVHDDNDDNDEDLLI
ncbi:hypothetical protein [Bacillus marasmi]|uniref:hypothetical protein n=1 Tax=Bacillus marasmi TaxID=1926279 RepID=UPI0011CBFB54|nr:hypothetical protein [Bacillus marasmi]